MYPPHARHHPFLPFWIVPSYSPYWEFPGDVTLVVTQRDGVRDFQRSDWSGVESVSIGSSADFAGKI